MRQYVYPIVRVTEYILAALFVNGGMSILSNADVPTVSSPVLGALISRPFILLYGISWIVVGLALIVAKTVRLRRTHSWCLFYMALTTHYVLFLSWAVNGLTWSLLWVLFWALVSAALYLRWKYVLHGVFPEQDLQL